MTTNGTTPGRLAGKTALITGSDSGIGQATAIEFAREGADLVVHYLHDEQGASHTKAEVEAAGRRAVVVQADVSDEDQVSRLFDEAVTAFGSLDILMNSAGVDASGTPVAELSTAVWDRAIRTNVYGYFFCARRFIQLRLAAGEPGKIINVSSVHADNPNAGGSDYDCSKGAIRTSTSTAWLREWCSPRSTRPRSTTRSCSRSRCRAFPGSAPPSPPRSPSSPSFSPPRTQTT